MSKKHQCEYLEYQGRACELVYEGEEGAQRWVLWNADGLVMMQVVLFCPCCGEDFRSDCWWQIPGRPTENRILAAARAEGEPRCHLPGCGVEARGCVPGCWNYDPEFDG